ncbi:MAG: chorismate mutase [Nodosilinea sp.]
MDGRVWAIRGAVTVAENTAAAMAEAVTELLEALESRNQLAPTCIISATFSVTRDLDAVFPAAIARQRPGWGEVALLDVQQMHVKGSLPRCIRVLVYVQLGAMHPKIQHAYLREAQDLRPDLAMTSLERV